MKTPQAFIPLKIHLYGFWILFTSIDHVPLYQLSLVYGVFEIKDDTYLWHQNFLKYAPLNRLHRKYNVQYNTHGNAPQKTNMPIESHNSSAENK